jgi:hypothetical protein
VIQQQHTPAVYLVETKLIDAMDGLPLAILLKVTDPLVFVDLEDPFLNIGVTVV